MLRDSRLPGFCGSCRRTVTRSPGCSCLSICTSCRDSHQQGQDSLEVLGKVGREGIL